MSLVDVPKLLIKELTTEATVIDALLVRVPAVCVRHIYCTYLFMMGRSSALMVDARVPNTHRVILSTAILASSH